MFGDFDYTVLDRTALPYLAYGLVCLIIGFINYDDFFQCDYVQIRDHDEWTVSAGYTVADFIGLALGTFLLPLGLVFILVFAVQSFKGEWYGKTKIATYLALSGLFLFVTGMSGYSAKDILLCGVFCFGDDGVEDVINNAAIVSTSMLYFLFGATLTILFAFLAISAYYQIENIPEPVFMTPGDPENRPLLSRSKGMGQSNCDVIEPHSRRKRLQAISVFLVFAALYPLMIFACTALPTWWAYFTRYSIQEYQADEPDASYGYYWSLQIGDSVILKLFPDILLYYGAIYIVSLFAYLSQHSETARSLMHRRPFPGVGICLGEYILGTILAGLLVTQFLYWYLDHGWEQTEVDSRSAAERAARALGQVANMVVGLLVLPVSRNSVWATVFGVSWESMIKYHQILGYLLISLVLLHVYKWWTVFLQENTFPHDIFAVPLYYHQDNFTVPLAIITTTGMLILMGVLSHHTIRRANYDLFYWAHHFSMVVFLMMLWHSTMSWYYITAGLVLWAVDHAMRLGRSVGMTVNLQHLQIVGDGDVVQVGYTVSSQNILTGKPNAFRSSNYAPLQHQMGQYCFVNIPEISQLAWHPFTISSVPGDALTTHHIKATCADQWTGRLLSIARQMSDSTKEEQINNLVVNIDGPYGLPIQTSRYRNLLLIAGGIGITPIHAIYKYILQCTMGADRWSYAHIKKIRLLWVCRTVGDVAVMDESFREIQRYLASKSANNDMSGGPIFSFTIYVTGTESRRARGINIHAGITREKNPQSFTAAATAYISSAFQSTGSKNAELKLKHGRPDLQSEILSVSPWRMEGLVYVCGPQSLVQDTGKYAAESRVDFGYETFAL